MSQRKQISQISAESSFDMGSQPSIGSNESAQTVREMQKFRNTSVDGVDDPLIQADIIAKRKQLAKEKFLSEGSISNGECRQMNSMCVLVLEETNGDSKLIYRLSKNVNRVPREEGEAPTKYL